MQARIGGTIDHVEVPDQWLKRFTDVQAPLRSQITALEKETIQIQFQLQAVERELLNNIDSGEAAVKRHELTQRATTVEREKKHCEKQLATSQDEYQQWTEQFAGRLYRRRELMRKLPGAPDVETDPTTIRSYQLGQVADDSLSKSQIKQLLLEVNHWLAVWTQDPKLIAETEKLEKEIADSRPYITLKNSYVRLADGSVIEEKAFQQLAIERGADVVSKGACNAFPKGARVDRQEAARLNLV